MSELNTQPTDNAAEKKPVKIALIVIESAALLTIVLVALLVFMGGGLHKKPVEEPSDTTDYSYREVRASTTERVRLSTTAPAGEEEGGGSGEGTTYFAPVPEGTNAFVPLEDPSGWSWAKILSTASDAINRTKAFKGQLSVDHTESFVANVTQAEGVPINLAQAMMRWVAKPVTETLVFNNGSTVNSEGETVPILLPKRGPFTLTESGLTGASIALVDNQYDIKLSIVREQVGMYDVPVNNAAAIGYLDAASMDLSLLTITSAFIDYQGSWLQIRVNSEGLVTYAEYHIPMDCGGAGHGNSIFSNLSGSLTFEGEQSEIWRFHW
ncbi:MAG: hypothetical protein II738_03840 [Clostridia bacterium]|nr:hypothetical protein [Clostridia bacterium]